MERFVAKVRLPISNAAPCTDTKTTFSGGPKLIPFDQNYEATAVLLAEQLNNGKLRCTLITREDCWHFIIKKSLVHKLGSQSRTETSIFLTQYPKGTSIMLRL